MEVLHALRPSTVQRYLDRDIRRQLCTVDQAAIVRRDVPNLRCCAHLCPIYKPNSNEIGTLC